MISISAAMVTMVKHCFVLETWSVGKKGVVCLQVCCHGNHDYIVSFQKLGLSELEKGSDLFTSLRGPLCSVILISYHTVVCYVLGEYYMYP